MLALRSLSERTYPLTDDVVEFTRTFVGGGKSDQLAASGVPLLPYKDY